jgi:hypothetical protein
MPHEHKEFQLKLNTHTNQIGLNITGGKEISRKKNMV